MIKWGIWVYNKYRSAFLVKEKRRVEMVVIRPKRAVWDQPQVIAAIHALCAQMGYKLKHHL